MTVGEQASNVKFSFCVWSSAINVEYSIFAMTCSDVFGCVNVRNKKFCILNKQYTEEEYKKLREKIIHDMNERSYVDSKGRVFKYGEFFPYDISPYDYNGSTACWYFPLSRKEVLEKGWRWYDTELNQYATTMKAGNLPDSIYDVPDSIISEVIECAECKRAFRVISRELELLRRFGLPIPRSCPSCRYRERFSRINPPQLWNRTCAKCGTAIQTSYAPERPEIVYCEQCYQAEVV